MINPIVIAEIGGVHIGNLERAKMLARLAKLANANILKTQKRNPYESVPKELWDKPHPNPYVSYGKTYLEHRINLELSIGQHAELKKYCEEIDIEYSTSIWDLTSAKEIIGLKPKKIKIPSACNMNFTLMNYLFNNYDGEVHVSLGMTTKDEREIIHNYLKPYRERIVVYHCTSIYPCPFEKLYLLEIKKLKDIYPTVGFSNHGYGIASDILAMGYGCNYFERHFVDDRAFRHGDAAASLEPDGLRRVCRDLKNVSLAISYRPDELDEIEKQQQNKLRSI